MKKCVVTMVVCSMLLLLCACGKRGETNAGASQAENPAASVQAAEPEGASQSAVPGGGYDADDAGSETAAPQAQEKPEESAAPAETEPPAETAAPAAQPEETDAAAADGSAEELVDGMRPAFKEAMDSYEAFYDEYCDFMKKYDENPEDFTLLANYAGMWAKMDDLDKKFEAWDEDDLNNTEAKYYVEVNSRVMQKLLDVGQ